MKVMVPLADGFEDIEAFAVIDVLRRAGLEVETVGVIGSMIQSKHGVRVMVDKRLHQVVPDQYHAIVLPGGSPGYQNLEKSSAIVNMVKDFYKKGKVVAAICGAVSILSKNGLLDDKRATIYPGMEKLLSYPRDRPVIEDGNVITSQGPGTAMEFAVSIVKKLKGPEMARKLKKDLVMQ